MIVKPEINHKVNTYVKKDSMKAFLGGVMLGCVFFIIFFGIDVLNPTNIEWISGGKVDLVQSYIGWCYYRESPWTLPLGHIESLFYDIGGITVINTDSIPIMALFFKILSPLLPGTFQYFGIWELLCMGLQGGFASLFLYRYIKSVRYSVIASSIFVLAVPFVFRMFAHCALSAQFVVLAAWCIWAYRNEDTIIKAIKKWSVLAVVAILIHPYLVIMVGILMAIYMLDMFIREKNFSVISIPIVTIMSAAIVFTLMGGFYGVGDGINNNLLGQGCANLNAWFDSNGASVFIPDLESAQISFYGEGLNYLGFGIILLLPLTVYNALKYVFHKKEKFVTKLPMFILVVVTIIISCLPNFWLGDKLILSIPLPEILYKILDVFQSNGRFMWILTYGLMLYSIISVYEICCTVFQNFKFKKIVAEIVLIIVVVIQIVDISPWVPRRFKEATEANSIVLESEFWDELFAKVDYIDFIMGYRTVFTQPVEFRAVGTSVKFNEAHCARVGVQSVVINAKEVIEVLKAGNVSTDTGYIITDVYNLPVFLTSELINVYNVDGHYVAISKEIELSDKWNSNKLSITEIEIAEGLKINSDAEDMLLVYSSNANTDTSNAIEQMLKDSDLNQELDLSQKEFIFAYDINNKQLLASSVEENWTELNLSSEDMSEDYMFDSAIYLSAGNVVPEEYSGYLGFTINSRYVWGYLGEVNIVAMDLENDVISWVAWIQDGKMYVVDNFQLKYK